MPIKRKRSRALLTVSAVILLATIGIAQTRTLPDRDVPPIPLNRVESLPPEWLPGTNHGTWEKSIAVDPKVNISLCVLQGKVNINGWARNEVRIFVREGSKPGFKVLQKSRQNDSPVWIMVVGADPQPSAGQNECLWGSSIDIDVPADASINLKGKETKTSIDTVRKVSVKNIGGDIILRNISEGVSAATYEGDVAVENSEGAIMLESSTGNIIAIDAGPSQVGDIFKAKTNSGAISLQKLTHRQIEVNSISGSVFFNGNFLTGGTYSFGTSNGSITLGIPLDSSALLSASYGYGNFESEVQLKDLKYNTPQSNIKSLSGLLGKGEAKLNLTTTSGRIVIRKQ